MQLQYSFCNACQQPVADRRGCPAGSQAINDSLASKRSPNPITVKPLMFACPLFREFREVNENAN